jgi:hypothetical protein
MYMRWQSFVILGAVACLFCIDCKGKSGDRYFVFGAENLTSGMVTDIVVAFSGNAGTWQMGGGNPGRGEASVGPLPGPVPDAADVSWKDSAGRSHKQHIQITPLPPATYNSYLGNARIICFVIQADSTVQLIYHSPLDTP